jgi:hypothetical protein
MKNILTIIAIILISLNVQADTPAFSSKLNLKAADQSFGFFRVHRMADDASLSWGISNPLQAASFVIERSYDGVEFEAIDVVAATGASSYKYRDNTVFPGFVYYRITCVNSDNSETQSAVVDLRIVKRK